ncbi:MAG: hypothetical protein QM270_07715 [Bacillota bacterium]|nr:hypothetical protein [Bacillota bacterium]
MFRKVTSPLLAFVALLCAVIAYQVLEERSLNAPPQATVVFRIMDWSDGRSGSEIRNTISKLARQSCVQAAQIVQDPADPRASRILYTTGPGSATTSPSPATGLDIPPEFGHLMTTKVVDGAPPGLSPIGEWSGWGSESSFQDFIGRLSVDGIAGEIISRPIQLPGLTSLPISFLQIYACLVLLIIGMGIAQVVSAQHTLAVQQLHGVSFVVKLWHTLAAPATVFAAATIIIGIVEALYCFAVYDGAYLREFVGQTVLLAGVLIVFLLAGIALAAFLYHRIDPLPALQGATPGRSLLLMSWLLHGLLLIVVASLGTTALGAAHRFDSFRAYAEQIRDENLSVVQFGGVYTPEQEAEVGQLADAWITEVDLRGNGLVAHHATLMDGLMPVDVLYVNNAYLDRNPGEMALQTNKLNSVHVYRPGNVSDAVFEKLLEEVAFQNDSAEEAIAVHDVNRTGTYPTYSMPSPAAGMSVTSVSDPVVVVLPQGSAAATAFALSGDGFFVSDGDQVLSDAAENPGINRYLRSITPLSTIADQIIASTSGDLAARVSAFIAGVFALLIVTLTGVVSYGQYARRRLAIQYLFGWRPGSMYLWFIILEALAAAALGVWFFGRLRAFRAEQESYLLVGTAGSASPFYAVPGALLAFAISFIVFVLGTTFVHRHLVRKGAIQ